MSILGRTDNTRQVWVVEIPFQASYTVREAQRIVGVGLRYIEDALAEGLIGDPDLGVVEHDLLVSWIEERRFQADRAEAISLLRRKLQDAMPSN